MGLEKYQSGKSIIFLLYLYFLQSMGLLSDSNGSWIKGLRFPLNGTSSDSGNHGDGGAMDIEVSTCLTDALKSESQKESSISV